MKLFTGILLILGVMLVGDTVKNKLDEPKPKKKTTKKKVRKGRQTIKSIGMSIEKGNVVRHNLKSCRKLSFDKKIKRLMNIYQTIHKKTPEYSTIHGRMRSGRRMEHIVCTPIRKYK